MNLHTLGRHLFWCRWLMSFCVGVSVHWQSYNQSFMVRNTESFHLTLCNQYQVVRPLIVSAHHCQTFMRAFPLHLYSLYGLLVWFCGIAGSASFFVTCLANWLADVCMGVCDDICHYVMLPCILLLDAWQAKGWYHFTTKFHKAFRITYFILLVCHKGTSLHPVCIIGVLGVLPGSLGVLSSINSCCLTNFCWHRALHQLYQSFNATHGWIENHVVNTFYHGFKLFGQR